MALLCCPIMEVVITIPANKNYVTGTEEGRAEGLTDGRLSLVLEPPPHRNVPLNALSGSDNSEYSDV